MAEIIKETITSGNDIPNTVVVNPVATEATQYQTVEYLIYYLLGALEILLAFRIVLKMAGASMRSGFVGFIYGLTGIFIMPFEGIFRRAYSEGIETTSVLEPSAIVALIAYAVLAWGIVKLLRIFSGTQQTTN